MRGLGVEEVLGLRVEGVTCRQKRSKYKLTDP